jgi:5-(carboxyamino)imidazole ribonucleotide synthase
MLTSNPQNSIDVPDLTGAETVQRIGVIGGGQLAWMMAEAAPGLGVELTVQTPQASDPAVARAAQAILGDLTDVEATKQLAATCDVITFENEFVDLEALGRLAEQGIQFRPGLQTLAPLLDKYEQRLYLQQLGLPVPAFAKITPDFDPGTAGFKFPLVVKSRRHGYDGQGTFVLPDAAALNAFWQQQTVAQDLEERFLVEAFVPFERELALIAARSATGALALYPIVETQQIDQVCRWVIAPAALEEAVELKVTAIAQTLLNALGAVGLFGIELFLTADGNVLVNEIAPRTHNSGHFTLDACDTSQFEQHLRAISNRPLGNTTLRSPGAVMVNLLGFETSQHDYVEKRSRLAALPQAFVHWYGKTQSHPGRKLGHITVLLDSPQRELALAIAKQIETIWYGAPQP